jgi:hypothetical protein
MVQVDVAALAEVKEAVLAEVPETVLALADRVAEQQVAWLRLRHHLPARKNFSRSNCGYTNIKFCNHIVMVILN